MSAPEHPSVQPDPIKVRVTLVVTTTVKVDIRTDTGKTVEEMRQSAVEKFDRAGGLEYRSKFSSDLSIHLVSTKAKVGSLETIDESASW